MRLLFLELRLNVTKRTVTSRRGPVSVLFELTRFPELFFLMLAADRLPAAY